MIFEKTRKLLYVAVRECAVPTRALEVDNHSVGSALCGNLQCESKKGPYTFANISGKY
jgi:hypothetical protein